jgi:uncharacterized OB-fold protein
MTDILAERVLPQLDLDNTAFWTSGQHGILRIEQCQACETFIHPPTGRCPSCYSTSVAPTELSGRGTLYSYTINYQQWTPGTDPYVVVLVDLEEGTAVAPLRLTSNLVGTPTDEVTIGMPVEVFFVPREDVWIPQFRAASSGNGPGT